jgi:hypothetical protein
MKITVSGLLFPFVIIGTLTLVYISGESVVVRIAKYHRYGNSGQLLPYLHYLEDRTKQASAYTLNSKGFMPAGRLRRAHTVRT